jgi:osomolarity two-component system sensor histidine kinase NIK1
MPTPPDPFVQHLVALLSVYEVGPRLSAQPPAWNGQSEWYHDTILRGITALARRAYTAEDALDAYKAANDWETGSDTKKRRSVGVDDPSSASSSTNGSASPSLSDSGDSVRSEADEKGPHSSYPTPAYTPAYNTSSGSSPFFTPSTEPISTSLFSNNGNNGNNNNTGRAPTPGNIPLYHGQQSLHVPTSMTCPNCGSNGTVLRSKPMVDLPRSPPVLPRSSPLVTAARVSGKEAVDELTLLRTQVKDIALVCRAVARGDLTKKITVAVEGEVMIELKEVINTMVDSLGRFSLEVTRVAREVGTDGILGGVAHVDAVEGVWLELTQSVNRMSASLTEQVRSISHVTTAVAAGDLSQQIRVEANGEIGELKTTINSMVNRLRNLADQVTRVTMEVGQNGVLGGSTNVYDVEGVWADMNRNVNRMCQSLTEQVRSIASVTTAVASGDLSKQCDIAAEGEIAVLRDTVNGMVGQLRSFSDEVTRVAKEVGTQGILGGQARVPGVRGTWADLTNNVNNMAQNLTEQVRAISSVTKAVAAGDLSRSVEIDAQGEMLDLKRTVNTMVSQLNSFSSEVTRVAMEVGTKGILGGQAKVDGVQGTWGDLTNNVNVRLSVDADADDTNSHVDHGP